MSALLQGIIKSALTSGQLGQDIATTALKEIFGVDSSASAGGPAEAAPAALPAGGASSASDNIQFNETGEAIDLGKRSVLQEGFSEGLAVRKILETGADLATQAANARVQWQITKINMDGSVLLTKILPDGAIDKGNTTSVAVDDFLGKFKEVVPLELDPRLPFTIDSEESIYQGAVFQAMYKKQGIAPVDGVFRLVLKPSKAVISLRSWSTGTLVSLPLTTYSNLKALDLSEEDPSLFTATFQDINGVPQSYAVHAPGANKDFVCMAFHFRTVEDESKANLKVTFTSVSVPMWSFSGCPKVDIKLPTIVATKQIETEDELILYKPITKVKDTKRKAKDAALDMPAAKAKKDKKDSSTGKTSKKR